MVSSRTLHEGRTRKYLLDTGIKTRIEGYVQRIVMEQPDDALAALYKMVGEDVALREKASAAPKDVQDEAALMDQGASMKGSSITASIHGMLLVRKPPSQGGEEVQVPFSRYAADHHATPVLMESWCRDLADAVRIHMNPKFAAGKMASRAVFNEIDSDNDGSLSFLELYEYCIKKNPDLDKSQFEEAFKQLDLNGDGRVSLAEFEVHLGIRDLPEQVIRVEEQQSLEDQILAEAEAEQAMHEEVEDLFDQIDRDGSGTLTFDEVWADLNSRNSGMTIDQAQILFETIDVDGDGQVTMAEFKAHMGLPEYASWYVDDAQAEAEMQAEEVFDTIDQDRKGFLSLDDLWDDLESKGFDLTREQVEDVFRELDVNGDGKISLAEFKAHMGLPDDLIAEAGAIEEMHVQAEQVFDQIDVDFSGTLEFDEIWDFLSKQNATITRDEAMEKFKALDLNGDGKVSLGEFKQYLQLPDEIAPESIPIGDGAIEQAMGEEAQQQDAEAAFDSIDVDGDGYLDFDEIWADLEARTGLEITRDQAMSVFQELDLNGDGKVSMAEFKVKMGIAPREEDVMEEVSAAAEMDFDIMDSNGSGFIEFGELWDALQSQTGGRFTEEQVREIFNGLDVNGDGKVSIVEFKMSMGIKPKQEEVMEEVSAAAEMDFDIMDSNGSGFIEFGELWDALQSQTGGRFTEEQVREIFNGLDVNGDGKVSIVEFKMSMGIKPKQEEVVAELHEEVENEFANIDTDMSGYIEFNELWADMESKTGMEISRQQAQAIFEELDVNGDGKVSLVEFKMKAANLEPTVQDVVDEMHNEAEATFDALDTDGSGYIEPEELWADLQKRGMPLTREQVDQIFAGIDLNADGKVSLVEFKAQMGVPLRHYEVIDEMHDNAEEQFDDLDKDKSGYIELEELWADLQKRGMTEVTREMVEELFKKLDANGDGKVSMAEFKTSLGVPLREYEIEEQMHEDAEAAFAKMDKDGDGFISMEEIEADLKRLGMESVDKATVEKIFNSLDKNGDGKVSMSEFKGSLGLEGFDITPFEEAKDFAITGGPVPQTDAAPVETGGAEDAPEAPRGEPDAEAAAPEAAQAEAAAEGGDEAKPDEGGDAAPAAEGGEAAAAAPAPEDPAPAAE